MRDFFCFYKKHAIILTGVIAVFLMILIQLRIEYIKFYWSFVISSLWVSVAAYLINEVVKNFKLIRNQSLSECVSYLLLFISLITMVRLLCLYSAADLPLVPYPLIDPYLAKFDAFFHFNVADITEYTRVHLPQTYDFFINLYYSLERSVILTLVILPWVNWKSFCRMVFLFFFLMVLTYIFCYFFPSIGPAYSYPDHYFSSGVVQVKNQYLAFRHNHTLNVVSACISCPSWHALASMLIVISWWPVRRFGIRYFVALYGILLIVSVFITGWHYLADVVGSLVFMAIALYVAKKLEMKVPNYDFSVPIVVINLVKSFFKKSKNAKLENI